MESPQFIRAKLVNLTNSNCSNHEVKNSRYHYHLNFRKPIGWEWMETQVAKANEKMDVSLEMWEIHPSGVSDFEIEVRELKRRRGIDDNQQDLSEFERNV